MCSCSVTEKQVGMMNAMRTGNLILDMVIAMSIPLVLQGLVKLWEWLRPIVDDFIFGLRQKEQYFFRSIDYEQVIIAPESQHHAVLVPVLSCCRRPFTSSESLQHCTVHPVIVNAEPAIIQLQDLSVSIALFYVLAFIVKEKIAAGSNLALLARTYTSSAALVYLHSCVSEHSSDMFIFSSMDSTL